MNNAGNGWWITEYTTYKIFAETEEEARREWNRYWCDGEEIYNLDITLKDGGVEADWSWTREDGE